MSRWILLGLVFLLGLVIVAGLRAEPDRRRPQPPPAANNLLRQSLDAGPAGMPSDRLKKGPLR